MTAVIYHISFIYKSGEGNLPLYTRTREKVGDCSTAAARGLTPYKYRMDCDDLHEILLRVAPPHPGESSVEPHRLATCCR